ncbi:metallophosphoesterase family protein [Microvirga puerhi]|uniref:Metallophosphatase family protein n=1 Tax=Microvirga puerhi TaxID=2876078 RepID=A0ABS7VKB0_9HYPH|nr:metallophosphoesterase family protein [Microvirga puerhi]MBZ6075973.1 metallophosphatase family protein [Microvirga puerhi]
MKIAVLSDIHGNVLALDAVLADLDRRKPDRIVNLGDCVSGPLWPKETMDRLHRIEAITIRGNHERQLATLGPDDMGPSDRFAHDDLDAAQIKWLGDLPETAWVVPGVLASHGTPHDDNTFLIDAIENGRLVRGPTPSIEKNLGDISAQAVLCGHSHRTDLVRLPNGTLVLNPGSVGCPAVDVSADPPVVSEAGTPHARYALLHVGADGTFDVDLITISYAFEEAAARAEANGRPDWAHGLRTGHLPRRS